MKKSFLFAWLATGIVSCGKGSGIPSFKEEKIQSKDAYFKVLGYGYPNTGRQELMEGISEKWKIKHLDVAGCAVTQELMDSIDIENKKTYAAIEKKYGKDWKIRYEKDLDDYAMKRVDIMDVLITNRLFREQIKKCNIEVDGVDKEVKQLNNSEVYEVKVYGYDENNRKNDCCTLHVDTKNRKVNLIK
jgi:hypothetical protein